MARANRKDRPTLQLISFVVPRAQVEREKVRTWPAPAATKRLARKQWKRLVLDHDRCARCQLISSRIIYLDEIHSLRVRLANSHAS